MAEKTDAQSYNFLKRFMRLLNREYLVFLFLLFLSVAFWTYLTGNKEYEGELRVCVKLSGCPKNVVLLNAETDTVSLTIKDSGWQFAFYYTLQHTGRDVYVPFNEYKQDETVSISIAELQRMMVKQQVLATSTKIVSTKRDGVTFRYNMGKHKRVPVRFNGILNTKSVVSIMQPDSVDVYATDNILKSLREIRTDTVSFELKQDTIRTDIALEKLRNVKAIPDIVNLTLYRITFVKKTTTVRVERINEPKGKRLTLYRPRVDVTYYVDQKIHDNIKPEMFRVVADYNDVADMEPENVELRLLGAPNYVKNVQLLTTESKYQIDEIR